MLAVFTVTNLNDAGAGSLRQAILDANRRDGRDTIEFDAAAVGTIDLTTGSLFIFDDLTINGPGADRLTIDANDQSKVFEIGYSDYYYNVDFTRLTITGGFAERIGRPSANDGDGAAINAYGHVTVTDSIITGNNAEGRGGGIYGFGVTVTNSTISGNRAAFGGGIYSFGVVTVTGSTISGNTAVYRDMDDVGNGGGIFAYNDVRVTNSTISDNTAGEDGGGIFAYEWPSSVTVTVTNSTISGNTAGGGGGGIFARNRTSYEGPNTTAVTVTVTNSTISGNTAGGGGGGVSANTSEDNSVDVTVINSTISRNTAGGAGGISVSARTGNVALTVNESILSGNTTVGQVPQDVGENVDSFRANHSLIGRAASAQVTTGSGNISEDNPQLGPLADNGGPTETHALLPGSPAIDAGDPDAVAGENGVPLFDQRGAPFARVVNGRIDIGAYESRPPPADLTGDGFIDFDDLTLLLAHWH
ncbi:MAG: right-handed parallel beta-helix repeat-containing protein, partial [Planctomycetes bacterium]|nr:right-handed parallel beta-helix repeat-containing protein [Planctomycetota bacterium]